MPVLISGLWLYLTAELVPKRSPSCLRSVAANYRKSYQAVLEHLLFEPLCVCAVFVCPFPVLFLSFLRQVGLPFPILSGEIFFSILHKKGQFHAEWT